MNFFRQAGMAAIAALLPLGANGAVVQYNSLASFNAATTGNIVEHNTAPVGGYTPIGNSLVNGIGYGSYAYMVDPAMDPLSYDWGTGAVLLQSWTSTLTFAPTTAFGALFGSFRPYGASMMVEINGVVHAIDTADHPTLTFFGWTSDTPFTSVTFWNDDFAYAILDDVTRADAIRGVPEPGSLALLGLAVLALAIARSPKRR